MTRSGLASIIAASLLGACLPGTTGEPSAVVGVETQRGHVAVLLADGRRCRAAFPAPGTSESEGRLERCSQPWGYRIAPAPVHGQEFMSQVMGNVVLGLNSMFSPVRPEPMMRMRIEITDERGEVSFWEVQRGAAPGTAGVRL